jgi:hypothetical protein
MTYAANTYQDSQFVLDKAMALLKNELYFGKASSRNFESDYKGLPFKTGRTIDYRIDTFFIPGQGSSITPQSYVERIRPLTVNLQPNVGVSFATIDSTFERMAKNPYLEMRLRPMMRALANSIEGYITDGFAPQTYLAQGVTSLTSPAVFNNAIARMTAHGIPMDGQVYCGVGLQVASDLANSLFYNTFNQKVNSMAFREGFIGELLGLEFFRTSFLGRHISGTGAGGSVGSDNRIAAGVIATAPADGATSLILSGFPNSTAGVINAGDVIELGTLNTASAIDSVNQINKRDTGYLAQFVATATVNSDGSGNVTVPISPAINWSNTNILQNTAKQPVVSTPVFIYASHNLGIAYHKEALVVAMPPMAKLEGGVETVSSWSDDLKAAIRYSKGGIILDDQQIERMDSLLGYAINPEFACRIMIFNV